MVLLRLLQELALLAQVAVVVLVTLKALVELVVEVMVETELHQPQHKVELLILDQVVVAEKMPSQQVVLVEAVL
jgi:hypothetical protein